MFTYISIRKGWRVKLDPDVHKSGPDDQYLFTNLKITLEFPIPIFKVGIFLMPGAFWTLAPGKLKVRTHIADKSCESIKAFHMGDLPWDIGSRQSCRLGPVLCRNTFPASQRICTPRHPPGCTARAKFRRTSLKTVHKVT